MRHSFSSRERHESSRIELDLQPTGRTVPVWRGGPDTGNDEVDVELRDAEQGDVIAEGVADGAWYDDTPPDSVELTSKTYRLRACLLP